MELERRAVLGVEVRQGGGQPARLRGYGAVFNARSLDLGGFVEIIRPGAFARSLHSGHEVFAFVEHDPTKIIGKRSVQTSLVIAEDAHGLSVEITPPADTPTAREVLENVRVGLLDSMSFGFRVASGGERWDFASSPPLRELLDLDLAEVSIVARPAYPQTEVALRSLRAHEPTRPRPAVPLTVIERLAWSAAKFSRLTPGRARR